MREPCHKKFFCLFLGSAFLFVVIIFTYVFLWMNTEPETEMVFGITYSWVYAQQLGLDPKTTYRDLVEDLKIRRVRIPLYWSEIQQKEGLFDWTLTDDLVRFSEDHQVELTLVIGAKVPRWPECFIPDWAESLDVFNREQAILVFLQTAVERYRDSPSVIRWQVENEPFFPFGQCPSLSTAEFEGRVQLVRSLDARPIQVSVSGEFGSWAQSARLADVLGISLYRQTWNTFFGYLFYPFTPDYYFFRSQFIQRKVSRVIVSELQAEPWFSVPIQSRPLEDWYQIFTAEMLNHNVQFVREAGFSEVYFWGAEWWYRLKQNGEDRLWETAKLFFTD